MGLRRTGVKERGLVRRREADRFYDDHIGQNHDQPTGEAAASIPFRGRKARITSIITEINQKHPKTRIVNVAKGALRTRLTECPVFIETEQAH